MLLLLLSATLLADAYTPEHDNIVLEVLPKSWQGPAADRARKLKQQLAADPKNITTATSLARHYIDQAKQYNEPRYYGYAEHVLTPWNKDANAPTAIRLLRAVIKQHFHQFSKALDDINAVIERQPSSQQAWLTRATLLQVMGYPMEAAKNCTTLARLATPIVAVTCLSHALSSLGDGHKAYNLLLRTHNNSHNIAANIEIWALTTLAEIANRIGNFHNARQHFKDALQLSADNAKLLAHYSDFLIAQHDYEKVISLLHNQTRHNSLLLRLVIAEQALHHPQYKQHKELLSTRLNHEATWDTYTSLRDQARFHLTIMNHSEKALYYAQRNWQQQKELSDFYLLLQSAIAAKQPIAAAQAIQWVQQHQISDVKLNQLIVAINAMT